jgi:hypothetical protein
VLWSFNPDIITNAAVVAPDPPATARAADSMVGRLCGAGRSVSVLWRSGCYLPASYEMTLEQALFWNKAPIQQSDPETFLST